MKNNNATKDLLKILESQKITISNLKSEIKIMQRKLDKELARKA